MDKTARLKWPASILVAAMAVLVSVLLAKAFTGGTKTSLDTASLLPCTQEMQIEALGAGVLYSDGTALHALNASGRQIWYFSVGAGLRFSVGEGGIAAWSDAKLYLLKRSDGSLIYSGTLASPILSANMGAKYAAVLTGTENDATLVVMEKGGRTVDSIQMNPEFVLDYGFFNDGGMLWVMKLNTEGTTPFSSVSTYNPGRTLAGTVTDSDQTVYQVFFQQNTICSVGTSYARFYDYYGVEDASRRLLVYGWYLTTVGGSNEKPLMAFAPISQTDGGLSISDVRLIYGDADRIVRMPFPCFALASSGGTVYGVCREYVMICGVNDVKPVTYALPVDADRLIGVTDDDALILASGENVYLVPLK